MYALYKDERDLTRILGFSTAVPAVVIGSMLAVWVGVARGLVILMSDASDG
jgi:hypothetical protein